MSSFHKKLIQRISKQVCEDDEKRNRGSSETAVDLRSEQLRQLFDEVLNELYAEDSALKSPKNKEADDISKALMEIFGFDPDK